MPFSKTIVKPFGLCSLKTHYIVYFACLNGLFFLVPTRCRTSFSSQPWGQGATCISFSASFSSTLLCPSLIHVYQAHCTIKTMSHSHSCVPTCCVPVSFICIRPCVSVSFSDSCIQSPLCPILIHLYQALCPSLIQ